MPYRDPAPSPPTRNSIPTEFWREENTYLEAKAVGAADTAIMSGLDRMAMEWVRETQNRYPKDAHVIMQDLEAAVRGRGSFLKVRDDAKRLVGILTLFLRFRGYLVVNSDAFDRANQDPKILIAEARESAIRWVSGEGALKKIVSGAFVSASSRLDRAMIVRFENVNPPELMKVVYFRAVLQGDTSAFDSFQLAQDLFKVFYE